MPVLDPSMPVSLAAPTSEPDAVAAVYACYAAPLYRFILRRVGDPLVAEDLLQDVFVRMLVGLPAYEDRGYPISAWLYKIAACRAVDWLRGSGRRRTTALEQVVGLASEAWPDGEQSAADCEGERQLLLAALEQLTERQASVIRLRFVAELPTAEVAQRLGLTLGMVKSLQHRGLATLRRQLVQQGTYHSAEAV